MVMLAVSPPCREMRSRSEATSSKESPQEGYVKKSEEKGKDVSRSVLSPFTMEPFYTQKAPSHFLGFAPFK